MLPSIQAYILTCPRREAILAGTLARLAATDWGEPPVIVCDQPLAPGVDPRAAMTRNARRLLQAAASAGPDFTLFLEDDLEFNQHLRHNLLAWTPLRDRYLLLGSLYNPGVGGFAGVGRSVCWAGRHFLADPNHCYGSQAFVLSAALVQRCLAGWAAVEGMQDIRISRIAGRVSPVMHYHLPSLVQHCPTPSTWGGSVHRAADFHPTHRT